MTESTISRRNSAPQQPDDLGNLGTDISANHDLFTDLLGGDETAIRRFQASAYHAVRANPKLLQANRYSLLMALGEAAAAGLDPNPQFGECWLIPRKGVVCFQVGYKGLMKLARRGGPVRFHCDVVRKGDVFKRLGGTDPRLIHEPLIDAPEEYDDDKSITAAYAVAWVGDDPTPVFKVVRLAKLFEAAARSGSSKDTNWSDVWNEHFEAMCLKTAIARVTTLLPRVDELAVVVAREAQREAGQDVVIEQLRDMLTSVEEQKRPKLADLADLPMPGSPDRDGHDQHTALSGAPTGNDGSASA